MNLRATFAFGWFTFPILHLKTSGLPSMAVSSTLAVTSISIGVAGDVADMDMDAHRALRRREERAQPLNTGFAVGESH